MRAGADKVVLNSALFEWPDLVREIASTFGQQCVVGSVDVRRNNSGHFDIYIRNGTNKIEMPIRDAISYFADGAVGEIYLNSIDRDGTGQGYDFEVLASLPEELTLPVIMAGGAGNSRHFAEGLNDPRIDAVATAHLFNFVGDGLKKARYALLDRGAELASWPDIGEVDLHRHL
jgi:cyclase